MATTTTRTSCPRCKALNFNARCSCTSSVVADDTLERINAIHLIIPVRRAR